MGTREECAMVTYVTNLTNPTFQRYKSLPTELKIWILGLAERHPRIIIDDNIQKVVRFAEQYQIPPIIQFFPQTLDILPNHSPCVLVASSGGVSKQEWVSFDQDIIYLNENFCRSRKGLAAFYRWDILEQEKIQSGRRLAVSHDSIFTPHSFFYLANFEHERVEKYSELLMDQLSHPGYANAVLEEILVALNQGIGFSEGLRLLSIPQFKKADIRDAKLVWNFSIGEMKEQESILQEVFHLKVQHTGKQIRIKIICQFFPFKRHWHLFEDAVFQRLKHQYPYLADI